ncbi:MAG: bifunctional folylpolyglutamate synthase/dihydrofolate synthase [Candidatus Brocadiaceae bacterium]|nr:bifunctional folylpolyglutamate synthase/dihydrofolate synthase [Candidatus Brocadiaceae bacterium]
MKTNNKNYFQIYEEAVSFLHNALDYEKLISYQYNASTFSLDRMEKFLAYVENPHKNFPSVHITGTKGKGSTAIMISTILENAGLTTGLFTSPHIIDLKERIQINHRHISEADFISCISILRPYIQQLQETEPKASPTFFEILTVIGMLYFKMRQVSMAVLEVGLGGRLDSTNVVIPQVSVITNIGLDHTSILGNTLSEIAYEKAGIIKKGVPVVSAVDKPAALSVIDKTCRAKDAKLYLLGKDILIEKAQNVEKDGTRGLLCTIQTWHQTYENIFLPVVGIHQAKNCALALGAMDILQEQGYLSIDEKIIRKALAQAHCPARIEVVSKKPLILLDFSHTAESMRFLKKTILENFVFHHLILVLGFSRDKDLNAILKEIVPVGDKIIVTQSKNPRAALPEDLCRSIEKINGIRPEILPGIQDAVIKAKRIASPEDLICITGSVYVAGEAKQALRLAL